MKKILAILAMVAMTLTSSAQEGGIRVNYQGSKPSISNFVTAFLNSRSEGDDDCTDESFNAVQQAWNNHLKGKKLMANETLNVDEKNGFVLYEIKHSEHVLRVEMCYWNEADQKHKLFAYNVGCYQNGKYSAGQFDGLTFYRYNNATKKMAVTFETGFDVEYGTDDGCWASYALPRTGKDIIVTYWKNNTKKQQKTLKWQGSKFSF